MMQLTYLADGSSSRLQRPYSVGGPAADGRVRARRAAAAARAAWRVGAGRPRAPVRPHPTTAHATSESRFVRR